MNQPGRDKHERQRGPKECVVAECGVEGVEDDESNRLMQEIKRVRQCTDKCPVYSTQYAGSFCGNQVHCDKGCNYQGANCQRAEGC